jgi:raffinose/stachyose/melibiose transport system permease protein
VPKEIDEAAVIDGCSVLKIMYKIIFPVIKPAIATVAVLSFLNKWNELMYSLVFLSEQTKRTLPSGLTSFVDKFSTNYTSMLAGLVISIIPIIIFYIIMENEVVEGLTAGSVKG